jgi:hypothetical protein
VLLNQIVVYFLRADFHACLPGYDARVRKLDYLPAALAGEVRLAVV